MVNQSVNYLMITTGSRQMDSHTAEVGVSMIYHLLL